MTRFVQVFWPMAPSEVRPWAVWNALVAAVVLFPKTPSMAPGLLP